MKFNCFWSLILGIIILFGQTSWSYAASMPRVESGGREISKMEFQQLVNKVADGWNEGDAEKAASAFSKDAIYVETPDEKRYIGRAEIYRYSGGSNSRPGDMKMTWHNLVFDDQQQFGLGEFTFGLGSNYQIHGVASMKVSNGLISNWRQYYVESPLLWDDFADGSRSR